MNGQGGVRGNLFFCPDMIEKIRRDKITLDFSN
jgi:hypothetical protein